MALSITKTKLNKLNYNEVLGDQYQQSQQPITHTTTPICTGTSVVALKYKDGVVIATDDLVSYGSMAKFKGTKRIEQISENVAIASTGEFSDFQELLRQLNEMKNEEITSTDNIKYTPKEFGSYVARIQYYRRSKVNPYLLNNVVVGYTKEQGAYIATVDQFGTYIEADYATTGFAGYLCKPNITNHWKIDADEQQAKKLLADCFTTLFYRDARSSDTIQIAVVNENGVRIEEPFRIQGVWDYKGYKEAASEKMFKQ